MSARELARAGHTVYAGIRDTAGRNAPAVADAAAFAAEHGADLRTVELDVADQDSVDAAIARVLSLAVSYAAELARFGIDTSIVVPGSFTSGTNHFAHAGHAADEPVAAAYEERYAGLLDQVGARLAELAPPEADPTEVARAIVRVVDAPAGQRPFRVHVDPADDGAEVVNAVGDRVRTEFYRRIRLDDLLHVRA
jgi:NAD(P)-dependent dehydrogenase (short-subunit alcohol dehydrogenase family)